MAAGTDGELITYDTSGDPTTVPTGSSGEVLTSNGAGTTPTFQAAAGGGKVLQVVSTAVTGEYTSTTTTYSDLFSATITPVSTTSKILVLLSLNSCASWNNNTHIEVKLLRDSTILGYPASNAANTESTARSGVGSISIDYLDSPSTTSAITYKTQLRSAKGGSYVRVNTTYYVSSTSTITLMEIGA